MAFLKKVMKSHEKLRKVTKRYNWLVARYKSNLELQETLARVIERYNWVSAPPFFVTSITVLQRFITRL